MISFVAVLELQMKGSCYVGPTPSCPESDSTIRKLFASWNTDYSGAIRQTVVTFQRTLSM